ncbi:MAG: penicillin-binding protein 2 [Deferribacteraceae bacterium]|jgi:penicillin-binding protein 2|nr:penicillin-binding protein 2 [Deferribacteraceae bacterium]
MLFSSLKDDVMNYFKNRGKYSVLVVFLLCCLLLCKLLYFQIFRYEELYALSEKNRIRVMRVRADRGVIKERNGVLLVKNSPGYELEIIKEDIKNVGLLLDNLSSIITMDKSKVMRRLKRSYLYEPVKVTRGLNFEQISYLMEHSAQYPGVQFVVDPMRSYLDGSIFSHIIGYMQEVNEKEVEELSDYQAGDIIGRSGIEKQFEEVLRGKDGSRWVEVDSVGRVTEILSETASVPGNNVILTIDYRLQQFIDTIMEERQGSVVVLDGTDNSVLALYSAPTYDLNMFNPFITSENWQKLLNNPKKPLLNRPIEGAYPPGSVFKILAAVAGLMENTVTPETRFFCNGSFRVSPRSNIVHSCWKKTGHGEVALLRGLSESCDVYFYNLGYTLGIDKLHEYSNKFSLGRLTGISLPNEKSGIFPSKEWKLRALKEPWYPGETVNISIGQGYTTVTPLQIAVMVSSIFNGGNVYRPRIVDAIEDPFTESRTVIPPEISVTVTVPKHIRDIVMRGIVMAVEGGGGTSWRARSSGVRLGGKTGTAQVVSLKRTENMREADIPEHWRDHSWFTGIYPAEKPRYTIVVMIEHGGSGGRISAPLAGAIVNKMLDLGYVGNN